MSVVPLDLIRDDIYSYAGIIREYRKSLDFDRVADALRKLADQLDAHTKTTRTAGVVDLVPNGWHLVPEDIHPLDSPRPTGALLHAMANPPNVPPNCGDDDWYALWWKMLIAAAPKFVA